MNWLISAQPDPNPPGPIHTRTITVDRTQLEVAPRRSRPRILVVDDQVDIALTCAEFLSLEGYPVATAFDGLSALEKAMQEAPDVALLDIGLPGLDGYEVGRRLRQHFGSRIRLIALTAYGLDEHRERTRAAGFDYHLVKPADLGRLQDILEECAG